MMAMILPYNGKKPNISSKAYIMGDVTIVGDVDIGDFSSIWYYSVLRGDVNKIVVGNYSNIQDGCVVHVDSDADVNIGDYVTIGHRAVIHGCSIGSNVLIGMGSIIMNGAKIGDNVVIGAGTLVTGGKEIPPGCMVYGNPARIVRELTGSEIENIKEGALEYIRLAAGKNNI